MCSVVDFLSGSYCFADGLLSETLNGIKLEALTNTLKFKVGYTTLLSNRRFLSETAFPLHDDQTLLEL